MGSNWAVIGVLYECDVTSIVHTSNTTHVTGFRGTHLPGFSAEDVGTVAFFYLRELRAVPQGIEKFFPNMISFRVHGFSVESVTGVELYEYKKLRHVILAQTHIIRLPGNFFSKNLELEMIDLSLNRLQHVGGNLLDNLHKLGWVDFSFNICIDEWARRQEHIPELKENLRRLCPDIAA